MSVAQSSWDCSSMPKLAPSEFPFSAFPALLLPDSTQNFYNLFQADQPSTMPSCQGRWTIAKPSKVAVDPYFSTLTGYQHDADRKQISASKNQHSRASRVPKSCDSSSSNSQDRRGDGIGPKLGEEPEFTESGQRCQKKNNGKTNYTDNERVRDKRHVRRPGQLNPLIRLSPYYDVYL
jgi:hypothetical protein